MKTMTRPLKSENVRNVSVRWALLSGFALVVFAWLAVFPPYVYPAAAQDNGDAARGKTLYDQQCLKCHALDEDKEGPRLRGIFGSKAATLSRFNYSVALRESKVTWDAASLNKWLADPDGFIPDADMRLHLDNPNDRADVIAYLKTISK